MKFMKNVRMLASLGMVSFAAGCGNEAASSPDVEMEALRVAQTLEILDPAVDLSTYTLYPVEQRQGHPEAGEPEYAYIAAGTEGVSVEGPVLAADSGLFLLEGAQIQKHPQATREDSPYTFRVTVNPRLSFDVKGYDYDHEVALAAVRLTQQGASLQSEFVFSSAPFEEGVVHDLVITPVIDGTAGAPTSPVSIESRFVASAPLEILNPAVDLSTYTQYESWELTDNPAAERPWYIYLHGGTQAAKVEGPIFQPEDAGLFVLEGAQIQKHPQAASDDSPYTFRVTANPRLSFDVKLRDYDGEVELASVKLFTRGPHLESVFTFSGSPVHQGVAHDLVITPFIDAVAGTPTWPESIESRF
ncbi:hypothetical protein [Stigmatella aurantiaca]|uniref:Lipoprotein n=1 Tax=Stigmatella aurantiaca (strain DW4/3-1) TaxID=378806 RepID=Q08S08_STIAD|nr:hypothetical protein [Stigmatella aurantiaca]ADO72676.1 uncharacterized protein STAUR_4898 [Stigmatella aurantiaca DW4/3-1]EAU63272.1 hypothetical protein STIAU_0125 [Stigmatella aurantiaca DW4/3-1]